MSSKGHPIVAFQTLLTIALLIGGVNLFFLFFGKRRSFGLSILLIVTGIICLFINYLWFVDFTHDHRFYPEPKDGVLNTNHQYVFLFANVLVSTTSTYLLYLTIKRRGHE